jgi:hypothetical protein
MDSYTKLMLHLDYNAQDVSASRKSISANNVFFGTGQFWGGAIFNGSSSYLTLPNSADFQFGSGDFTIDCWIYKASTGVTHTIYKHEAGAYGDCDILFRILDNERINTLVNYEGSDIWTWNEVGDVVTLNTWHHVALVRNGTSLTTYLDGVAQYTFNVGTTALHTISSNPSIGADANYPMHFFNGMIDEFRISKGIARWTTDFTPNTEPYDGLTLTISNAGGNALHPDTWVEGIVPTIYDDVVATATSGNLTLETLLSVDMISCNTFNMNNYVGTIYGTDASFRLDVGKMIVLTDNHSYNYAGRITVGSGVHDSNTYISDTAGHNIKELTFMNGIYQFSNSGKINNFIHESGQLTIMSDLVTNQIYSKTGELIIDGLNITCESFIHEQNDTPSVLNITNCIIDFSKQDEQFPMAFELSNEGYADFTGTEIDYTTPPFPDMGSYLISTIPLTTLNISQGSNSNCVATLVSGLETSLAIDNMNIGSGVELYFSPSSFVFENFTVLGEAGLLTSLYCTTEGQQFTLNQAFGTIEGDYLNILDSVATGGATWLAGSHSNDLGNNSGWYFNPTIPAVRTFLPCSRTTIVNPAFRMMINTGSETEFTLPLTIDGVYDFIVDWGDTIIERITSYNQAEVTHTYSLPGEYTIALTGVCTVLQFSTLFDWENGIPLPSVGMLTRVSTINNLGLTKLDFSGCSNLTSIVKLGNMPELIDLSNCFSACTSLTSIPANMFDGCINVQLMSNLFSGCSSLTFIPNNLFKYNTSVTDMSGLFMNCSSLTSIPVDIFRYNTLNTSFAGLFQGCILIMELPVDIFRYNTLVTTFDNAFQSTDALTTLPTDIFRYNTAVERFVSTFYYGGVVSLPVDLFRYNTAVTTFQSVFSQCPNLETYEADLFRYNTNVTEWAYAMEYCPKLQVRSDTFFRPGEEGTRFLNRNSSLHTLFTRTTFTGIQGTAPALWDCDFGTGVVVSANCFSGAGNSATSLSNYASIPSSWINP